MKILQLSVHFSPNLGGVETHLDDLVSGLIHKKHQVFVLTYRPLSVKTDWKVWETRPGLQTLRLPWLPGWFNKLSQIPAGEFLYLVPGLFIALPFVLLFFRPNVIHAHGLSAGFAASFWGRIFGIRTVISTHSIYNFPKQGFYRTIAKWIFSAASYNLCLSNQSIKELVSLGVKKVGRFTYWVNLQKFKPIPRAKAKLGWEGQFIVLFVGRLVPEKGIPELLEAAKKFKPGISLKIAGSGPLEAQVKKYYIGRISQDMLPLYYSAADLTIVPSTHDEGFGRVIIESLACGTPVIAANRGAVPEAMNNTIGKLITITPQNVAKTINHYYESSNDLLKLSKKARAYALKRYGDHNADQIVLAYNPKQ
ncbi:MAG: glycosyltransferase [Microgenomates group bacterium Gr01-1014_16]|nr:MAG: glycosyltransferase [Microgenomates group bacterium Gr01-1014_16]